MRQREYYRIPLTTFCSLRLRKLGGKMLPAEEEFEVEIQNISGGGLCFLSDRELPVSEYLEWQFAIDIGDREIEVYGQLVWMEKKEELYLYGVKFVFLEETEQRNLITSINTIQIRRRQREKYITG